MVATVGVRQNFAQAESASLAVWSLSLGLTEKVVVALTNAGVPTPLLSEYLRSRAGVARSGNVRRLQKSGIELVNRYAAADSGKFAADSAKVGTATTARSAPANCLIRQLLWRAA